MDYIPKVGDCVFIKVFSSHHDHTDPMYVVIEVRERDRICHARLFGETTGLGVALYFSECRQASESAVAKRVSRRITGEVRGWSDELGRFIDKEDAGY